MPITSLSDEIYIKNIALNSNEAYNNIVIYNAEKARIWGGAFAASGYAYVKLEDGVWHFLVNQMTGDASASFFRFSAGSITDQTIVTVNEKIE
jgi:hypothetical protein